MQQLNLPSYNLSVKDGEVFDIIRKKYVRLTPEEWVRQNFVHFLISEKGFPKNLMSTETSLSVFNTVKRTDITVFSSSGQVLAVVECKAPYVEITQSTFSQIARYNITLKASFLIVTNGLTHYCIKLDKDTKKYEFLKEIPKYNELI
ncbi:MAG: type I restriction enzyme HsdR N-terminal domain-containing protein [Bacteroidales bacterium]|nr:type I restriction enzyme HsdR N-terminal domain-containing protein [Bacteroidales bacterium]